MLGVKNFQDLYAANLSHRTGVIKEQLEAGLYMLKRVGFFLRKVATAKKSCSVELSKFSEHETEKNERASKDHMHNHVNAYQQMQNVMTQMSFFELKFANDLLDRVAEPLLSWHKDAELRLKKLIQSEEKLEASMATLRARLKSERATCIKGWTDLTKEYREWQKALQTADLKKVEKMEKSFLQKREKLHKMFQKYEQLVEAGNAEQKAYWTKELPTIVSAYELLEVERCNEFEARLRDFHAVQQEYAQPFPNMVGQIEQAVNALHGPNELKEFVGAIVATAGKPQPPISFVDGLPVESKALSDNSSQSQLGSLLNQDPSTLAAQREAEQLKIAAAGLAEGGEAVQPSLISTVPPPVSSPSTAMRSPSVSSPSSLPPPIPSTSTASVVSPPPVPSPSSTDPFDRASDPPATFVRALYDFTSDDPDDLTFTLNTVIQVTLKGEDDELAAEVENGEADINAEPRWWRGQRLEDVGKSGDGTFPSNYVRVCGVERDMSLRHLLEIPSGLRVFSEFLKLEYASENIDFWCRVEQFRTRCLTYLNEAGEIAPEGREVMLRAAEAIAADFIGQHAASQVNISSHTLNLTQERLNQLPASLSLNMFDEAASEIMKMLSADSFTRFKRHDLFEKYLNTPLKNGQ